MWRQDDSHIERRAIVKKRNLFLVTMLVVATVLVWVMPASACPPPPPPPCKQGCTPGYWKQPQHMDSWEATGYLPEQTVFSAFGYGPDDVSLLGALKTGGGGETAFLRHAVAALLNASHPDVHYGLSVGGVITVVKHAYDSGDLEYYKDGLEYYNELGCPLN